MCFLARQATIHNFTILKKEGTFEQAFSLVCIQQVLDMAISAMSCCLNKFDRKSGIVVILLTVEFGSKHKWRSYTIF